MYLAKSASTVEFFIALLFSYVGLVEAGAVCGAEIAEYVRMVPPLVSRRELIETGGFTWLGGPLIDGVVDVLILVGPTSCSLTVGEMTDLLI